MAVLILSMAAGTCLSRVFGGLLKTKGGVVMKKTIIFIIRNFVLIPIIVVAIAFSMFLFSMFFVKVDAIVDIDNPVPQNVRIVLEKPDEYEQLFLFESDYQNDTLSEGEFLKRTVFKGTEFVYLTYKKNKIIFKSHDPEDGMVLKYTIQTNPEGISYLVKISNLEVIEDVIRVRYERDFGDLLVSLLMWIIFAVSIIYLRIFIKTK
jgi:hypothetical protein